MRPKHLIVTILVSLGIPLVSAGQQVAVQERTFVPRQRTANVVPTNFIHDPNTVLKCRGEIKRVVDVAYEGVKTTSFNWSNSTGGGEGNRFDSAPVLSTMVTLSEDCSCLDAHFSAMVGSKQSYPTLASITMFQVTLTPAGGGLPRHMVGHFDTPYNLYGPSVSIEAEHDVDAFAANFFQRIGDEPGDLPPGRYKVDVWWSGGPIGGGGALGLDFVLKLYLK